MTSEIVYVPWGEGIDQAIRLGAAWLREQPGDRLVLVHAKQVYENNPLLPRLTAGAKVAKPITIGSSGWRGGPVLAPWPTEKVLSTLADRISNRITAVCLLEWGEDEYLRAWVRAQGGTSLLTGNPTAGEEELLSPVVTVAMEYLSETVNHSNGLVQTYDKEVTIQALQALVRAGHTFDVDNLVAWALAHDFTGSEVARLRDYATKVLNRHRFRLSGYPKLRPDIVEHWEQQARDGSTGGK